MYCFDKAPPPAAKSVFRSARGKGTIHRVG